MAARPRPSAFQSRILILSVVLACTIATQDGGDCTCEEPTPCQTQQGCAIPLINDITKCTANTTDCRNLDKHTLCSRYVKAKHGFCCWTACSSLAIKRPCGDPPPGFSFEKVGERSSGECHDIMNVREKCCLHEMHIMKAVRPQNPSCPKLGKDLAKIFEVVDGNRESAPNSVISSTEVLHSLQWLDHMGYIFLANNFSAIDADNNHKISWYELEKYCGHAANRLPPENIFEINSEEEITRVLSNGLYVAAVLSSLVVGELVAIIQVIVKHVIGDYCINCPCRKAFTLGEADEGLLMRVVWTFFSKIWPLTYSGFQLYYYFNKIQWEVCDSAEGFLFIPKESAIQLEYLAFVIVVLVQRLIQTRVWFSRKCPTRPSKDLERHIYMQQIYFRIHPRWYQPLLLGTMVVGAVFTFYRAVFYGTLMDVDFPGLKECRREDPDLALLYAVNEKYFLWYVVQSSFLNVYIQIGWGIENKTSTYHRLGTMDEEFMKPKDDRIADNKAILQEEQQRWAREGWFQ